MMNRHASRRVDLGAVARAPLAAMQWRLLLLWTLLLLLPTAVVSLPLWRSLSGLLDHSVQAPAWAAQFSPVMFGDTLSALRDDTGWLSGVAILGLLLTLLLTPFLNGMLVGGGRASRVLGFGHLLQCGIVEYGRMFRLMLWSIVPYAVMAALIGVALHMADGVGDKAVLQAQADRATHLALFVAGVLFVLAQAMVESGRAAFIADGNLRSATRAFGRGFMQLLRRPFSTLLSYVLISVIGYAAALALGVGRVHTPALGTTGLLLAVLLTQLLVLVLGWVHVARVFALAEVARSLWSSRRGGGLPQAL
ncbi:hypothetical protein [Rhodanobacter denitrificans]|uniref:Uncharacterized protein n=1 Tax=Rhodanobacter denitrificans TaxID=666685 RepID=M4NC68_9GAMM|nr:hypothetical protein [Rhodanobacter denitrificans]AGG88260.1 hypothetical protein R2APBS1_1105 [Rhodanobacter denitrificans]UJM87405.1 hypothetical protein LRJ86_03600 [Rhodanobacter denitrificans]